MSSTNGKEKGEKSTVSEDVIIDPAVEAAVSGGDAMRTLSVETLQDRASKVADGLHQLKDEAEALEERLKQLRVSIGRTEGALIMLNTLLQELSPRPQGAPPMMAQGRG